MFWIIKQDIKGGFCPGGFLSGRDYVRGGFCPGGFCPGGFCPGGVLSYIPPIYIVSFVYQYIFIIFTKQIITMSMYYKENNT